MSARAQARAQFNRRWWGLLLLGVAPWLIAVQFDSRFEFEPMVFFVIGLLSLLPTLPKFRPYKRALWALQSSENEPANLACLGQRQRQGMLWASLPAWLAALFSLFGLDAVGGLLLVLASVLAYCLYRIPVQLLRPSAS